MTLKNFKIIFSGETIDGFKDSEVKKRLSELLKTDIDHIENLFSGHSSLSLKDADHKTVIKHKAALELTGAVCEIVQVEKDFSQIPSETHIKKEIPGKNSQKMTACPKCGFQDNHSVECIKCGIIFEKYYKKINPENSIKKENEDEKNKADKDFPCDEEEKELEDIADSKQDKKPLGEPVAILFRAIKKFLSNDWVFLSKRYITKKNPVIAYLYKVFDVFIQSIFLLTFTSMLFLVFFYFFKMFWHLYISLPMGKHFLLQYTEQSQIILRMLNREPITFSIELTVTAFVICMAVSAACQVFYLLRFFYLPQGIIGKICYWGIPLSLLVTVYTKDVYGTERWDIAFALAVIPTMLLFSSCFKFAYRLLPEIDDLIPERLSLKKIMSSSYFSSIKDLIKGLSEKMTRE